jgi:hypothetical protein
MQQHENISQPNQAQMVAEIQRIQQQLSFLQRNAEEKDRQIEDLNERVATKEEIFIPDDLQEVIPAHLQAEPLKPETRKKILRNFSKVANLPEPLTDKNGIVEKSNLSKANRAKIKELTKQQITQIEIIRMSASIYAAIQSGNNSLDTILLGIKSIAAIAADNATKLANEQLVTALHNGGQKGTISLAASFGDGFDHCDSSIIQACHVQAATNLHEYSRAISRGTSNRRGNASKNRYTAGGGQNSNRSRQNSHNRNQGGGRGRGRGGQRGRGRGRGGHQRQSSSNQSPDSE